MKWGSLSFPPSNRLHSERVEAVKECLGRLLHFVSTLTRIRAELFDRALPVSERRRLRAEHAEALQLPILFFDIPLLIRECSSASCTVPGISAPLTISDLYLSTAGYERHRPNERD